MRLQRPAQIHVCLDRAIAVLPETSAKWTYGLKERLNSGVAQRYAPFAFLCDSSPAHEVSCFVFHAVVDVSMLRTAEEAELRRLRATRSNR